ncbi:MAG: glutamine synthetase III [Oligoflexales bacterium]|nr:glutamine synthetase III [Oligoflexales bacterium]
MSKTGRSLARFQALRDVASRKSHKFERKRNSDGSFLATSEYFGCNTFSFDLMSKKMPHSDVSVLREFATSREKLPLELAEKVAVAVKEWALSKGATHYCHWFQPQTGATAEKHDSFFSFDKAGSAIENFTAEALIQSEPDASSFPSGGIRSTFEARGYTVWDASSPMFLMETINGTTLCIPSLFISYTNGEALDNKTPLLRSLRILNDMAVESLRLLGDDAQHVLANAGPEQEYFIVDEAFYSLRPDLILAGRTLLGRIPPRHQQLEDHYFGSIKSRILNYMMECEYELYKLGVPCKTRHNEVAPGQFETAPVFEPANVAADHNQLIMEIHKSVAKKHGLVCLLHEKPFLGVNGSGKHINWSISDNKLHNLLKPGPKPEENLRFLFFLTATIKAISEYGGLLRASVASAGNDFRLGANEAPPAIMSVFLGDGLTELIKSLTSGKTGDGYMKGSEIDLCLAKVPVIKRDCTDRNRTSPFAFTGNRFEFRAQGSSGSIAPALTCLNSAVAAALKDMNEEIKNLVQDKSPSNEQIMGIIVKTLKEHQRVIFNGNGYSSDWHQEAEKRGLPNYRNTVEALVVLKDPKVGAMLSALNVSSLEETRSRYNINLERFIKIRLIELETLQELMATHIYPGAMLQLQQFSTAAEVTQHVVGKAPSSLIKDMEKLTGLTEKLASKKDVLDDFIDHCRSHHNEEEVAYDLSTKGMELMEELRSISNELELIVDDHIWSLPKYREMLYHI